MEVDDDGHGGLTITHNSSGFTIFLFAVGAIMVGTAAYDYFIGARGTDRLVGLLAGAATCLLSAIVMLETGRFHFDRSTQTIRWQRRWGVRRRAGVVAFRDVSRVLVEVPIGDTGIPSRRICLRLKDDSIVPITVSYRPDVGEEIVRTAERIRGVVGLQTPSVTDAAHDLAEHGQAVAAVKLLVEHEGLSLTEAKRRIDATKRPGRPVDD